MVTYLARHLVIYRPTYTSGFVQMGAGWTPTYRVGDLRAQLFGVRVPILWAMNILARSDHYDE